MGLQKGRGEDEREGNAGGREDNFSLNQRSPTEFHSIIETHGWSLWLTFSPPIDFIPFS